MSERLILASGSPRRQELMKLIADDFLVITSDIEEQAPQGCSPAQTVELLALQKANDVFARYPKQIVIGADTVVAVDDEILGKPKDRKEAARMLQKLSGRKHDVYTGIAICMPDSTPVVFSERTGVWFTHLSDVQIETYLKSGEPFDKAGAYGIQGRGALFISGIHGDYYNVMGLPVCRLASELSALMPLIDSCKQKQEKNVEKSR